MTRKRVQLRGCSRTGLEPSICGHCRYPELYQEAQAIAREAVEKINSRAPGISSELRYEYRAGFVLETLIQILERSV